VEEFVNADTVATGLSAFRPEAAAIDAARVMLRLATVWRGVGKWAETDCHWPRSEPASYPQTRRMGTGKTRRALKRRPLSISELFEDGRAIDRALRLGVRDALLRHKLLGQRVATWKNGRVVILEPHEIPVRIPARLLGERSRRTRPRSIRKR